MVILCRGLAMPVIGFLEQNNSKGEKIMSDKRKDYLTWDEFFMGVSKLSAMRSKDPSTQVGACIVGSDNRILSIGYNGTPNGIEDKEFPWDREGEPLETKYLYVCHAEMNAILNYRGSRKELEGAKIYVDLFPCNECAKLIIQFQHGLQGGYGADG